jgi:hypothetical protein
LQLKFFEVDGFTAIRLPISIDEERSADISLIRSGDEGTGKDFPAGTPSGAFRSHHSRCHSALKLDETLESAC